MLRAASLKACHLLGKVPFVIRSRDDDGHLTVEGSRLLGKKYNLMGQIRKAAASDHSGRLVHSSKHNRNRTLRSTLPANIKLADAFTLVWSRSFTGKDESTRHGVSFRTTGMDARATFSKAKASIIAAGYKQTGKIRVKGEGRISGFFKKAGQPTLYVRATHGKAGDSTTSSSGIESTVWISWRVRGQALETNN